MKLLWPQPAAPDVDPLEVYGADRRVAGDRPWVVVNMISSVDGGAADETGLSGGLGGPGDRAVLGAVRAVADVIVAGAGTVVAEDYGPSRPSPAARRARLARGQAEAPRIAVATASLAIDPGHRLFREATAPARPLVLTVEHADPARRAALARVAEVVTAGDDRIDWRRALDVLGAATGARVVLCEGGPSTVAQLVADDLVDEMCVTVAPALLAGTAPRIATGAASPARPLVLDRVLSEDGYLFLRYRREPDRPTV